MNVPISPICCASVESTDVITTAIYTLIGGVILFVANSAFEKIWLTPIQKLREILGEIAYTMHFYAWIYTSVPKEDTYAIHQEACNKMRDLSSRLRAQAAVIPYYWLPALVRLVPKLRDLDEAAGRMIRISNKSSLNPDTFWDVMCADTKEVIRLLKLELVRPSGGK